MYDVASVELPMRWTNQLHHAMCRAHGASPQCKRWERSREQHGFNMPLTHPTWLTTTERPLGRSLLHRLVMSHRRADASPMRLARTHRGDQYQHPSKTKIRMLAAQKPRLPIEGPGLRNRGRDQTHRHRASRASSMPLRCLTRLAMKPRR